MYASRDERLAEDRRVAGVISRTGVPVTSVFDLVNRAEPYPAAIPVLLALLDQGISDDWIAEGVVRALTVREARESAPRRLLQFFLAQPPEKASLKWAVGNALYELRTNEFASDLLSIAKDPRHGRAREMIIEALGNYKTDEVRSALLELLHDEEVTVNAIRALSKFRSADTAEALRPFASSPLPLVRKEAQAAMVKLQRGMPNP